MTPRPHTLVNTRPYTLCLACLLGDFALSKPSNTHIRSNPKLQNTLHKKVCSSPSLRALFSFWANTKKRIASVGQGACDRLCVVCIKPSLLPVDIQHDQCPCRFFDPTELYVTRSQKLRHTEIPHCYICGRQRKAMQRRVTMRDTTGTRCVQIV